MLSVVVVQAAAAACLWMHNIWFSEKAMAPHSGTLAWRIPWTEEPGRLQPMGSLRVGHDWTTERLHFHALEKEMAAHSSVLAWRIPGTGEPGGLPSMGLHRIGTRLKRLSSSSSRFDFITTLKFIHSFVSMHMYKE